MAAFSLPFKVQNNLSCALHRKGSNPSFALFSLSKSSVSHQKLSLSSKFSHRIGCSSIVSRAWDLDSVGESQKPTILVSEKLGEAGLDLLRSFGNVECLYKLSLEDLCAKISECDALIVRNGTKVAHQVFEAAKEKLKMDLQAAMEFGYLVVNALTTNTITTTERRIALLASMARNVAQADAFM